MLKIEPCIGGFGKCLQVEVPDVVTNQVIRVKEGPEVAQ